MSVLEYLEAIKERLLTDLIVADFQIIRERDTTADGHIRARVALLARIRTNSTIQVPASRLENFTRLRR